MKQEQIDRINELYRKSKAEGLTEEEKKEQDLLRKQFVADVRKNLTAQLNQQGLTLEMYCQFMNTTEEKLREDARGNALVSVKIQAAIEQVVYTEQLEATKEEIGQAMAVIARQNRMTLEQLKQYVDAEFEAAVVRSVLTSKAMKLVRDSAEITEIVAEK